MPRIRVRPFRFVLNWSYFRELRRTYHFRYSAATLCIARKTMFCVHRMLLQIVEVYPKIFGNQQVPQTSILRRWYTQIPIFRAHGNNKKPKLSREMPGGRVSKISSIRKYNVGDMGQKWSWLGLQSVSQRENLTQCE